MKCPACSNKRGNKNYDDSIGMVQVYRCKKCGAVFGSCYKGDSFKVVKPFWHQGEAQPEDLFYYDLEVLGSAGVERSHGWAHKETRRIVQTG